MEKDAPALVLRCNLCKKPFDKPTTLKRHGYYCRSRQLGKTVRARSCIACAKGKARCDNKRPDCSRCLAKSIECCYPVVAPKSTGTQMPSPSSTVESPDAQSMVGGNPKGCTPTGASSTIPNADIENFSWGSPEIDLSEFLNPTVIGLDMEDGFGSPTSLVRHLTPSTNTTIHVSDMPSALDFSIPPTPRIDTRSLVLKSKPKAGPHRVVMLILHTLKSYPQMMLRHGTLPPFIHPHLVSSDFYSTEMELLNNCISLMHMISDKVRGSRKLFWKNVRLECERISAEAPRLNNWELLAAMHALSIYILLRMGEGETEYNNFDQLLLTTMSVTATHLAQSDLTYTPNKQPWDTRACWLEWKYMESRRRLSIVFRVINLIVYFDPGAMCSLQSDLVLAPLPSPRALWEAPDEFAWKVERDKQPVPRTAFGLTTKGELVRLDEMDLHGGYGSIEGVLGDTRTSEQNWEEWCSGMDSFGGLVLLAASLLG